MSGFVPGTFCEADWLTFGSAAEAWAAYHEHGGTYGYPVPNVYPLDGQPTEWRLHRRVGIVVQRKPMSMAEYQALMGQVRAAPSPGGSDKAARRTRADEKRISEREAAKAAKRREREVKAAAKAAEEERRREQQGSLLG